MYRPDAECSRSFAVHYGDGHVLASWSSRSLVSIIDRMTDLDGVETKDELLQWRLTYRKWKDAVRNNTSLSTLRRLTTMLTGGTSHKLKAVLAEDLIKEIEHLTKTHGPLQSTSSVASSSGIIEAPPLKIPKKAEVPSPSTPKSSVCM